MRINRVAASAIVGAVVGVAAVLSVAAASDDVATDPAPVDPAAVVVEVEETDPAPLDRDGYTVEVETGDAGEVAPVDPAQAPKPLPTSTPEPREETAEEVPALPVGAYVYFEDWELPDALTYGADVPCWQDLDERIVCWFEGATGAESQG